MLFINGRFYMNPAFGRALERARLRIDGAEDDGPSQFPVPKRNLRTAIGSRSTIGMSSSAKLVAELQS